MTKLWGGVIVPSCTYEDEKTIFIYVSPSGSDSNTGLDIEHPLQTIEKAMNVSRMYHPLQLVPKIHLLNGIYNPVKRIHINHYDDIVIEGESRDGVVINCVFESEGYASLYNLTFNIGTQQAADMMDENIASVISAKNGGFIACDRLRINCRTNYTTNRDIDRCILAYNRGIISISNSILENVDKEWSSIICSDVNSDIYVDNNIEIHGTRKNAFFLNYNSRIFVDNNTVISGTYSGNLFSVQNMSLLSTNGRGINIFIGNGNYFIDDSSKVV